MKTRITTYLKTLTHDRSLFLLSLSITGLGLVYLLYVLFSVSPEELRSWMRYSTFSEAQFYKDSWYHLYLFGLLAVVIVIGHIGIMTKLSARNMRPLALAFGWFTLLLLVIAILITHSVLDIGRQL
jgi:hypothetical protein